MFHRYKLAKRTQPPIWLPRIGLPTHNTARTEIYWPRQWNFLQGVEDHDHTFCGTCEGLWNDIALTQIRRAEFVWTQLHEPSESCQFWPWNCQHILPHSGILLQKWLVVTRIRKKMEHVDPTSNSGKLKKLLFFLSTIMIHCVDLKHETI